MVKNKGTKNNYQSMLPATKGTAPYQMTQAITHSLILKIQKA